MNESLPRNRRASSVSDDDFPFPGAMTRTPRQKLARNFRRRLKSLKLSIKEARPELSYKLQTKLYNVRIHLIWIPQDLYN